VVSARARRLALVASLAVPLASPTMAPTPAWAQPDPYKQHMENGVKLFQDKNYAAALLEFEAAYAQKPKASPLLNVALAHKAMFAYPKAIAALEKALNAHGDSMDPADKKAAEEAIAEMRALLAHLAVTVTPAHATVSIDGEDLPAGAASRPIAVGPGTHRVAARAEGFASAEKSISVVSGEKDKSVRIDLAPDKGYVYARAGDPRMAIAVDGKAVSFGSWEGWLAPGQHVVEFYRPGGAGHVRMPIVVAAGQAQEVRPVPGAMPPVTPPVQQPLQPVVPPPEAPKPKPPEPDLRGFFFLATATLLAPVRHPQGFPNGQATSGGNGGLRVGYRVNTPASFDIGFEYGNVAVESADDDGTEDETSYSLSSLRVGANLRLMTPGKKVRFVGTPGGGFVNDSISFEAGQALDRCEIEGQCPPDREATNFGLCEGGC
jgi:tetratricopeptide (TPR) repeat protein